MSITPWIRTPLHPRSVRQLPGSPRRLLGAATSWPVTSHDRARLNAQRSCSELALARRERVEVEEYLADLHRDGSRTDPGPATTPGLAVTG